MRAPRSILSPQEKEFWSFRSGPRCLLGPLCGGRHEAGQLGGDGPRLVVLVELCWVLQRLYGATTSDLLETVADLLCTPQFKLQAREAVQDAVQALRAGKAGKAGFADFLISRVALREGCSAVVSFDRAAIRAAGMTAVD